MSEYWFDQEWFDKRNLKIIKKLPVLWKGWELDDQWYLCEDADGKKVLVISDHENFYVVDAKPLQDKIDEYKQVLAESEEVMKAIKGELTD